MPAESKQAKTKDLSHVPCKFFKVGSCTAGASCPFAHPSQETGVAPSKEPCAWFVKGNCKFGHKCALAHILPGQPISMDRRNKKQAQLAAQAAAQESGSSSATTSGKVSGTRANRSSKAPLLGMISGSMGGTAPTRASSALKASPSAPTATPIAPSREASKSAKSSQPSPSPEPEQERKASDILDTSHDELLLSTSSPTPPKSTSPSPEKNSVNSPTSPLPLNTTRRTRPVPNASGSFGPIGSPPNNPSLSTSPASHGHFLSARAVSQTMPGTGIVRPNHSGGTRPQPYSASHSFVMNEMDERETDQDREAQLLPSSLTDLLPPRLLHRESGADALGLSGQPRNEVNGHRYSHSVPATSLLSGDLRSIWAPEPSLNQGLARPLFSPGHRAHGSTSASATSPFNSQPGSYNGPSVLSSYGNGSSNTPNSHGFISPSNASAAFLPNLHQNYHRTAQATQSNAQTNHTLNSEHPNSANYSRAFSPPNLRNNHLAFSEHAPGSSLPQGLAAGYSRIHALPPGSNYNSPPQNEPVYTPPHTSTSPFANSGLASVRNGTFSPPKQNGLSNTGGGVVNGNQGLDNMFSRLSFSAVAARPPPSTKKEGPLSPLSRATTIKEDPGHKDDDDLFAFD